MDLTTLQGDDTPGRVRRLCAKARQPVRRDLLEELGVGDLELQVAAVCVYHAFVETAVVALAGSGIPVAAVSTGFPAGLSPLPQRLAEIEASVAAGAEEIDIVITRAHVLTGNWQALYDEVRPFREACGDAHMKAILATGELGTYDGGREKAPAAICRKVIEAKLTGTHEIEIWGDGEQTRSFTYIDDCVDALLVAGSAEAANGKVYNLGSREVISLRDLADMLVGLGGGRYELVPFPPQRKVIDIGDYYGDFSLISKELGWAPRVGLKEGLQRTLAYYREHERHYWEAARA